MRNTIRSAILILLAASAGCRDGAPSPRPAAPAPGPAFIDGTEAAGLRFEHFNDASPRRLLPETMGSGVAFLDYDGDGWIDVYLANGAPLVGSPSESPQAALYRNLGDGRFADVSALAGLGEPFYGLGTAVADLDGNGWVDLYVSGIGTDRLLLNEGGRFRDASRELGLPGASFPSAAAFLDYDGDGWLDLFVGGYVEWTPAGDVACRPDGTHRVYCTPEVYPGSASRLYRNLGGQRLVDVSESSGIGGHVGKTLGVVVVDLEGDGLPDLAVANDTERNFLFRNQGDGTFRETAIVEGLAFSTSGATRGGMGIAAADLDVDGRSEIVIGNFAQEMAALYRPVAEGDYRDVAAQAGIGIATLMTLAFGVVALDQDGDGSLDLVFANGHIEPEIAASQPAQAYAQPLHLFLNHGGGTFELWDPPAGDALAEPAVGRGLAVADVDRDGDGDLVLSQNGRAARLLRNTRDPRAWIQVVLQGRRGNLSGFGARVTAQWEQYRRVRDVASGGSYLSSSEPVAEFAFSVGNAPRGLEVRWPSGRRQRLVRPAVAKRLLWVEPGS